MHTFYETGLRCRAFAMHNEFMCYQHRDKTIPPVIENEPFELTTLHTRESIQIAIANVAARLACNRMDLKRATLLLYSLQLALANIKGLENADRLCSADTDAQAVDRPADTVEAPASAEDQSAPQPIATAQPEPGSVDLHAATPFPAATARRLYWPCDHRKLVRTGGIPRRVALRKLPERLHLTPPPSRIHRQPAIALHGVPPPHSLVGQHPSPELADSPGQMPPLP